MTLSSPLNSWPMSCARDRRGLGPPRPGSDTLWPPCWLGVCPVPGCRGQCGEGQAGPPGNRKLFREKGKVEPVRLFTSLVCQVETVRGFSLSEETLPAFLCVRHRLYYFSSYLLMVSSPVRNRGSLPSDSGRFILWFQYIDRPSGNIRTVLRL